MSRSHDSESRYKSFSDESGNMESHHRPILRSQVPSPSRNAFQRKNEINLESFPGDKNISSFPTSRTSTHETSHASAATRLSFKEQLKNLGGIKNTAEMYIQVSSALEGQIQTAVDMKDAAEARMSAMLAAQAKLSTTIQQQKAEIADLRDANAALDRQLEILKSQFKTERSAFERRAAETKADNDAMLHRQQGINKQLEREIDDLQQRLKVCSDESKAAKAALSLERSRSAESAGTAMVALQRSVQELTSENLALRRQVDEQLAAISALKVAGESGVASMLAVQRKLEQSMAEQGDEARDRLADRDLGRGVVGAGLPDGAGGELLAERGCP